MKMELKLFSGLEWNISTKSSEKKLVIDEGSHTEKEKTDQINIVIKSC